MIAALDGPSLLQLSFSSRSTLNFHLSTLQDGLGRTLTNFQFTQNEKGEVTHYNGIPLPPIPTVEEAKAQAQKEIAAAKKAREAQQAEQPATRHSSPATPPQEVFFTGKPYLEETGQYLFLFRHYNPELARWTTADPSGFPDGANNLAYMAVPTTEFDWQGLKSVTWVYLWDSLDQQRQSLFAGLIEAEQIKFREKLDHDDYWSSFWPWAHPTHYLDDGDTFTFQSIRNVNDLSTLTADKIWVAAHGWSGIGGLTGNWQVIDYSLGGSEISVPRSTDFIKDLNQSIQGVNGCNPRDGRIKAAQVVAPWRQPAHQISLFLGGLSWYYGRHEPEPAISRVWSTGRV